MLVSAFSGRERILQAYQERRITRKDLERSVARLLHVLKLFEKGERI